MVLREGAFFTSTPNFSALAQLKPVKSATMQIVYINVLISMVFGCLEAKGLKIVYRGRLPICLICVKHTKINKLANSACLYNIIFHYCCIIF
jgi:hypothetical protein